MGTIDWAECAFCEYWVFDPYLHDPGGYALCDWCDDYLECGGAPNAPNHWWSRIQTTFVVILRSMDSHGQLKIGFHWVKCTYCEYQRARPELQFWTSLCRWCMRYLVKGGVPEGPDHWWSTVQTTRWSRIQTTTTTLVNLRLFPHQILEVVQKIATFLV